MGSTTVVNPASAAFDGADLVNQRRIIKELALEKDKIFAEYDRSCEKLLALEKAYFEKNGKLSEHHMVSLGLLHNAANPKVLGSYEQLIKKGGGVSSLQLGKKSPK